jgi:hypothetical protein
MSGEALFDESDEAVMELVLSSDDEFTGVEERSAETVEDRRLRRHEIRERFLPGVDAGALFAFGAAMVSLTSSGLIEIMAQNRELTTTLFSRSGSAGEDPWAPFRDVDHMRFLGQGVFAAAAVVIAAVALTNWRSERHARWSRPAAQAGLLLGLAGVVIALLGYFDVIASLPAVHHPALQDGGFQN